MKEAAPGEVTLFTIAYLEDRVRVNLKQNQLYGTQCNEIEGRFVPRPIEDLQNVNKRRKAMGLGTLEEGIAHMYKKYNKKTPD